MLRRIQEKTRWNNWKKRILVYKLVKKDGSLSLLKYTAWQLIIRVGQLLWGL